MKNNMRYFFKAGSALLIIISFVSCITTYSSVVKYQGQKFMESISFMPGKTFRIDKKDNAYFTGRYNYDKILHTLTFKLEKQYAQGGEGVRYIKGAVFKYKARMDRNTLFVEKLLNAKGLKIGGALLLTPREYKRVR